jgi:hypothetical protein
MIPKGTGPQPSAGGPSAGPRPGSSSCSSPGVRDAASYFAARWPSNIDKIDRL